jgi:hypothetical protein
MILVYKQQIKNLSDFNKVFFAHPRRQNVINLNEKTSLHVEGTMVWTLRPKSYHWVTRFVVIMFGIKLISSVPGTIGLLWGDNIVILFH